MSDYNGWTNYETWSHKLEFLDGSEEYYRKNTQDKYELEGILKNDFEAYIDEHCEGYIKQCMLAVMYDINWYELAESIIEG